MVRCFPSQHLPSALSLGCINRGSELTCNITPANEYTSECVLPFSPITISGEAKAKVRAGFDVELPVTKLSRTRDRPKSQIDASSTSLIRIFSWGTEGERQRQARSSVNSFVTYSFDVQVTNRMRRQSMQIVQSTGGLM
jgi:hypothetical protein